MKRLLFEKLTLLSNKESRGLSLKFDKKATILKGENDVGKSSIIKTLLRTFGTEPHKETDRWKNAQIVSFVEFSVDEAKYGLLRSRDSYALFDGEKKLIASFSGVTNGLSPHLAKLFNFHLSLSSRGEETTQATPAFLFLPFYADQDRSWVSALEGFERLSQFQNYRRDVVWFHTGIRPNEYYIAKAEKMEAEQAQEQEKRNRDIVMHAVRRVHDLFKDNDFSLRLDDFQKEVDELVQEGRKLSDKERSLKDKIVSLRNLQLAIDSQLSIVVHAASELTQDFDFAAVKLDDTVECPTCGAHYQNSVAERFAIAADEDRCRELIEELQDEKKRLREEYDKVIEESRLVQEELSRIDELLASKKGDINLREILQSEGKKEVKEALEADVRKINLVIGELDQRITEADRRMKDATDTRRSRKIKDFYRERMGVFLDELSVRSTESQRYDRIDCTINESGSDGPRALLAYQFAILHTINEFSSSTFCPIVIDSPNQQDQDEVNWARIRNFIKDRTPEMGQLILGLVDDGETQFGGNVYEFDKKYHVLRDEQFEDCAKLIRPLQDAMISSRL